MRTISNDLKRVLADGANVPTHFLAQHRSNECFVIFSKLKIFAIKLNSLECLSSRNDVIFSFIQWNIIIASNCNFDCRMLLAFACTRCERYAPTFDMTNTPFSATKLTCILLPNDTGCFSNYTGCETYSSIFHKKGNFSAPPLPNNSCTESIKMPEAFHKLQFITSHYCNSGTQASLTARASLAIIIVTYLSCHHSYYLECQL